MYRWDCAKAINRLACRVTRWEAKDETIKSSNASWTTCIRLNTGEWSAGSATLSLSSDAVATWMHHSETTSIPEIIHGRSHLIGLAKIQIEVVDEYLEDYENMNAPLQIDLKKP